MAHVRPVKTREKTSTTGTGDITVLGVATPDNIPFSASMAVGDTAFMCVVSGNGVDWEEFLGTYSAANTIQRTTTIINNSGTTAHISLAGSSRVFAIPIPSDFSAFLDKLIGTATNTIVIRGASVWGGISPSSLNALLALSGNSDANISSPANYDLLQYETSDNKWHNVRNKYIIGLFSGDGVLTASQDLLYHAFTKGVTFPANFGSFQGHTSRGSSVANATASAVVNVDKSTGGAFSNIGTITFAAGSASITFATSSGAAQSFAQGDILRVQAPSSADATLAGVALSLVGYET